MKAYIIKSAKNNVELEKLVNEAMDEGYVPQGGVQNDGSYFHQAMIRSLAVGTQAILTEVAEELPLGEENTAISSN